MALWSYGITTLFGAVFLLHLAAAEAISRFLGSLVWVGAWALVLTLGSLTGLISAVVSARIRPPQAAVRIRRWFLVEAVGCACIAAAVGVWMVAAITFRYHMAVTDPQRFNQIGGWPMAAPSVVFAFGYFGGAAHRLLQIVHERTLLAAAAKQSNTAEVLAEPDTPDG
jgi:sterol desaturase/sphingolipid hydroxylase (fatty acid hydroxylase superfamily)